MGLRDRKELINLSYYSFVIPCYNKSQLTEQAITTLIKSLNNTHLEKGIEIIVVNDGSIDDTKNEVNKLKKIYDTNKINIIPINLEINMGYPVAVNMGLAECKGNIISILNNDLIFPDHWFDGIVNTLENDDSIGMAVPYLSYAYGPQGLGLSFNSPEEMQEYAEKFMRENKDKLIYAHKVIGACMCLKKELLSLIGGNDFWFGMGLYDDDDICLRAGIAGYKIAIAGSSFVQHIGTVSLNQEPIKLNAAFESNVNKFCIKWNRTGFSHADREGIIENVVYNKNEHFIPFKLEHFKQDYNKVIKQDDYKKILFVADWTNKDSQWKTKLLNIINDSIFTEKKGHLHFWIPKTYFPEKELETALNTVLGDNYPFIKYIFDDIYPSNILGFLKGYNNFIEVENDYVNRYFYYLFKNSQ